MTLEEAIKMEETIVRDNERYANLIRRSFAMPGTDKRKKEEQKVNECEEVVEEHRQLAQWLKELKKYRAIFEKVGKILADNGYTIDDLDTIFGKVNEVINADEEDN